MLPDLLASFRAVRPGPEIAVAYGASGTLRRQVELGAPVDAVLFASAEPVDTLIQAGLADADTRMVVATNHLVLVAPEPAASLRFETLDQLAPGERLAIGDPGAVPAGSYARRALRALGLWDAVRDRLVFGRDVAAVLTYARRGEVAAAIVYATDLGGVDDVVLLDAAEASDAWAPRPEVVVARTRDCRAKADVDAFLAFLRSREARSILARHGFGEG